MRHIFLLFALSLGGYAWSDVPSNHKTIAQKDQKAEQKQSATTFDTSSLEKAIRESIGAVAEKPDPHSSEKLKTDGQLVEYTKQLSADTQRLADFTFWLVLATCVIAFIAMGQLYMFWKQLGLMTKSTEDAGIAANAALDAAKAAQSQAQLTAAEYIGTHIPHLIIRRVQLHWESPKQGIEFVLANVGDSYAQDISGDLNIVLIPNSQVRDFERQSMPLYGGKHYDISQMIADPKAGHDATLQAGEKPPVFIQSDKIVDTIHNVMASQNITLYFFGKIAYWNRTKTISREMGFFRTYTFNGDTWIFEAKNDDPDYEWN